MSLLVRQAIKKDIPRLLEIVKVLKDHFTNDALVDIENDLKKLKVKTVVAEEHGNCVGFLSYEIQEVVIELLWLAVLPGVQGKGIGNLLMENLLKEARGTDRSAVEIAVIASSTPFPPYEKTRKFYEKFGFREVRIDKDYYAPGDDRGIMRLELYN